MSEVKDRELIEYLDKDYKHIVPLERVSDKLICSCGEKFDQLFEANDHVAVKRNPTPTLGWMLGRLGEKDYDLTFSKQTLKELKYYGTYGWTIRKQGCKTITHRAETPILALRGAVEKMMEHKI